MRTYRELIPEERSLLADQANAQRAALKRRKEEGDPYTWPQAVALALTFGIAEGALLVGAVALVLGHGNWADALGLTVGLLVVTGMHATIIKSSR
jgi:hypothetical protein